MASVSVSAGPITLQLSELAADLDLDQVVEVSFPIPTIYSEGDESWYNASFLAPVPQIFSEGLSGIIGDVNIRIPSPRVQAGGATLDAGGNLTFKMPKIYSTGFTGIIGDVDITFPMPFRCIKSEGIACVIGDVVVTVPLPIMEITAEPERLNEVWKSFAMNTSNYSITEYNRWRFNSYANIDGDFYGADSNGIHVLDGNLINGEKIESSWLTGLFDFRSDFVKKLLQVWVVCRSEGELTLILRIGEENFWESNLPITIDALREIRGKIAKGKELRNRFFALGIKNKDGAPYTVKSIRAVVEVIRSRPR